MQPFEIIAAPFEVYIAPVGEAFPQVDTDPAGNWELLGTSGNLNYSDDGVTITHEQTIEQFRPLGSTGPIKAARTEEGLLIGLTLWDVTMEQYRRVLNDNAVTQTPANTGVPGTREVNIYRGLSVATMALLIRGPSPYDESFNMQYEVPRVFENASPEVVYQKGEPAAIELEFAALIDLNAATPAERFGRIVAQDAAAQ